MAYAGFAEETITKWGCEDGYTYVIIYVREKMVKYTVDQA